MPNRLLRGLSGWRLAAFAALATYVIGVGAFLLLGGAAPAQTSTNAVLVAADAEPANTPTDADTVAGDTTSTEVPPLDPAAPDAGLMCNDIDPTVAPGGGVVGSAAAGAAHQFEFTTLNGRNASLGAYAGCPLVVNFFASWCSPCVREMPEFEEFWQTHGRSVALVGLAVEMAEPARKIVEETGVTYLTGTDDTDTFIDFGGVAMPTTAFVDPMGNIVEAFSGVLDLNSLVAKTEALLGIDLRANELAATGSGPTSSTASGT